MFWNINIRIIETNDLVPLDYINCVEMPITNIYKVRYRKKTGQIKAKDLDVIIEYAPELVDPKIITWRKANKSFKTWLGG